MEFRISRRARLAWITEGTEIFEPEGWHVVAVVKHFTDRHGTHKVLVVQEREMV